MSGEPAPQFLREGATDIKSPLGHQRLNFVGRPQHGRVLINVAIARRKVSVAHPGIFRSEMSAQVIDHSCQVRWKYLVA